MADSPVVDSEGVVRVTVYSNGKKLPEAVEFFSVTVHSSINAVPWARIEVDDGDMAKQEFPVSDGADLKPGSSIRISAGYGDKEESLFEGVVVRHGLKITGDNYSRLLIECRDKATRMTVGRKNANYIDQKDGDIIGKLISNSGLSAQVDSTSVEYKELVQYYCTDWDFLLSRAEANGLLVIVRDGKMSVKRPDISTEPVLKVGYGVDLMEFQADIDARTQLLAAEGVSWDPKTQKSTRGGEAKPAKLNAQGDLDAAELAKVVDLSSYRLQTTTPLSRPALKQWADAQQLKAGLARIRGRMKFQGSAKAQTGKLIEVEGVGNRFSGKVFTSSVDHRIADGNWITEVEFGMSPNWFTERTDVIAPPASGLLPGVEGLQIGVVMKLDSDPESEQRIQVKVPVLEADREGIWARMAKFHASDGFGAFFVPEVGDEVLLGYLNNDPSHPVILGSLYSSKRPPPYKLEADNNIKAIVTRTKMKIEFDEKDKILTIVTPGNNKVVLSDKDKSILLADQNNNTVELNPGGISLDSPKDIKISAKGKISIDAVGPVDISSKADVTSKGLNVNCEGQVGFVGKGAGNAELSSVGQTVVKGAMVMIN
jgi:Rhs element Vgr protein